ncbi:MAG TPA: biotin--[acetyl-CoA-carboxylase] ligase [Luteolibacter sp.]|nr:biotin--[acetyl-CoA-carboxylase] ligase [Luteolibacter sp.]
MNSPFETAADSFPEPFRLLLRDSVHSTNDSLLELAKQGAPDGLVLLAHEQSGGRGRRGAAWLSSAGENLTFSILNRPTQARALWPRLSLVTGLAVAEAIESFGGRAGIKWPNDLWIDGRKVAGILVEATDDAVVVGIGINVHSTDFPESIAHTATSLDLALGLGASRSEVLGAIIARFAVRRRQLDADFSQVLEAVRQRCVLSGQRVSLQCAAGIRVGRVAGIGNGGELLLESNGRTEALIQADEVRILEESP